MTSPATRPSPGASDKSAAPSPLERTDAETFAAIEAEAGRQDRELELIASENYCSRAVCEAVG